MNTLLQKPKSRFYSLTVIMAVIWILRGLNLVSTDLWHGYVWIKRGFPASDLDSIKDLTLPQWLRIVMFFVGLFMLYTTLYAQRANTQTVQDITQ